MEKKRIKNKNVLLVAILVVIVAILLIIGFRKNIFSEDSWIQKIYEESESTKTTTRLFKTFILGIIAIGAIIIGNIISRLHFHSNNNTTKTALLLAGNVLKYVVIIILLLSALSVWGVDTVTLITGAGILTLVIGLGCQTLVSDVVAGIFMLFEGDIKVGDIVVINGFKGTVQQIGLRRTRIIDASGNINSVSNSSISSIINNTKELSYAVCDVGIEYDESIERVEDVLKKSAPQLKEEINTIVGGPFYKGVVKFDSSALVIRIVATCKEQDVPQTERDLNRAIKILFDKNKINIPFNQIVVNYRKEEKEDNK